MRAAVVVFPGTNCEKETSEACELCGFKTEIIFHEELNPQKFDLIILPGGFSYGDHISSGRIAKFSPIINKLKNFDGFILGICNGFQILCEAGFLPGALLTNEKLKFISKNVDILFEENLLKLPIAHHQGNYYFSEELPSHIKKITYLNNFNGSKDNIAGLWDTKKNIMGLMPHPERAVFKEQNSTDGKTIFESIKKVLECKQSLI